MNDDPKETPPPVIRVDLSVRTMLLVVGACACVWLFLQLWPILLVIFVALMIVGMLNPFITGLEHRGMKRGYAIALVFAGLTVSVGLFGVLAVPPFVAQLSEIAERLPQTQAQIATYLDGFKLGVPIAKSVRELHSSELVAGAGRLGLSYSSKVVEITAYSATAIFLALYLLVERDRMRGIAFALFPRRYHMRISRILLNLETIVGGYLRGQIITSVMMALFAFALLTVMGVPNAVALSLFAGIVDVLPYVGAMLVCGPAFFASLSQGTTTAVIVLLVLAAYQEFESRVIVPRIYGKVLRLPAATVMIAILVGGKLLGILGALLALPIAAGIRMIIEELRLELPGDDSHHEKERERDRQGEEDFEARAAGHPANEAAAIATEIAEARRDQEAKGPSSGTLVGDAPR